MTALSQNPAPPGSRFSFLRGDFGRAPREALPCPLGVRCVVILNEKAGKPGKSAPGATADELRAGFAQAGLEADIRIPAADQMGEIVRAAVAERPDVIVAGGGDGTVRCVAAALADTGIVLGVLPLGTLNHFAKDLQLPTKPADAIALLATG